MDKHYGFIYLTIDLKNGKGYIGQHKIHNQKTLDPQYIGSGAIIGDIKKKYGLKRFNRQILCYCENQEELDKMEIYYINYFNAVKSENFYNIAEGGSAGNKLAGKTVEEMEEIKKKITGKWNNKSEEEKEKINKKRSDSWNNKPIEEKQKVNNEKSNTKLENELYNEKHCYCPELNILFSCCNVALYYGRNILKIKINHPGHVCDGHRKSTGCYNGQRLHWKWEHDVDDEIINNAYYINYKKYKELLENNELLENKINANVNSKFCYCPELDLCFTSCKLADEYCRNILNIKMAGSGAPCRRIRKTSGQYNGKKLHWNFVDYEFIKNNKYIDSKKYEELISKNVNDCK